MKEVRIVRVSLEICSTIGLVSRGTHNRVSRREGIPHPPWDSLSPPPQRRKKGQILEPDISMC